MGKLLLSSFHPTGVRDLAKIMRKSNSRRLNISQIVVTKKKIRVRTLQPVGQNNEECRRRRSAREKREGRIKAAAKWCWSTSCFLCTNFHFIPFSITDEADFRVQASNLRRKLIFYFIAAQMVFIVGSHRYITFARRLFSDEPMDGVSCFCAIPCVIIFIYTIWVALLTFQEHETIEIIKGWKHILTYVSPEDGPLLEPMDDFKCGLASIQIWVSLMGSIFGYTVTSVAMPDLPFNVAPTLAELGWIDWELIPAWAWGLLFSPVETVLFGIPFTVITFMAVLVMHDVGAAKIYLAELR